jgi:acetyltransferase-like isoleucine patch superfamily enzyme
MRRKGSYGGQPRDTRTGNDYSCFSKLRIWLRRSAVPFVEEGDTVLTKVEKLRFLGENVTIYNWAKLIKEEVIEIGAGTRIDDFVLIYGGQGIVLGRYNHICSFVSIVGGGQLITGDYVGMAAGCRIITGAHCHEHGRHMVSTVPPEQQEILVGKVILERDVFLGSNSIVLPNVTIGEGAMIGAGSVVNRDVAPWTINMGVPARVIGMRPKVIFDE